MELAAAGCCSTVECRVREGRLEIFLTIVITLAIVVLVIRYGDILMALGNLLFLSIVLFLMVGLIALVVWSFVTAALS